MSWYSFNGSSRVGHLIGFLLPVICVSIKISEILWLFLNRMHGSKSLRGVLVKVALHVLISHMHCFLFLCIEQEQDKTCTDFYFRSEELYSQVLTINHSICNSFSQKSVSILIVLQRYIIQQLNYTIVKQLLVGTKHYLEKGKPASNCRHQQKSNQYEHFHKVF